ncbi:MAG: PQQ-dependent sugar dehydrogenase [Pseudomonadota bacterium]
MKLRPTSLLGIAAIVASGLIIANSENGPFERFFADPPPPIVAAPENQIESIFIALDATSMPIPVERPGSGGALTKMGDSIVLMTHEGRFFDVTGDTGEEVSISAPDSGWDAMLAFEAANPAYEFAHFYFRYNDIEATSDHLIVSFTHWEAEQSCYRTVLARAPLGGATSPAALAIQTNDWETLFETDPCLAPKNPGRAIDGHMAGGRFRVDENGDVILASGDYAVDGTYAPEALSQNSDTHYGKVLRISPETGEVVTLSQGHSNMQGVSFDENGDLFVVEHGRRGGDELNLIETGADYGWPTVSLGTRYNRLPLQTGDGNYGRHDGFQTPVYSWLPSVAISSLTRIDGFHPAWDGDLIAGSLAGNMLLRIRIRDGRVLFNERISIGERIRYVLQDEDAIVLWTDSKQIIKLSVGDFDPSIQFAYNKINDLDLSEAQAVAMKIVLEQCSECHNFGVTASENAPALGLVYDAPIASGDFAYSDALRGSSGNWTAERLVAYLTDPDSFAAGTSMPNPQLDDPELISGLVTILEALKNQPE